MPRQSAPVSPPPRMTTFFPRREDLRGGIELVPPVPAVLLGKELHGEADPREIAARNAQVARDRRSAGEANRVELRLELARGQVDPDSDARLEDDPFGRHEVHAPLDDPFLQFVVRNPVHEDAADSVGPLEDRDRMAGPVELGRGRETSRTGAHDGDILPRPNDGRLRLDPSLRESVLDDLDLDLLDRDRIVVDPEDARSLARGRTDAARELGKAVRRKKPARGLLPAPSVDEIVPLGDQVSQGGRRSGRTARRNPCTGPPGFWSLSSGR